MGKEAATPKKRTTIAEGDPTQDYFAGFDAKSQLVSASLNLGWQLAFTVLLPIFIGVQLDRRFDSSPSWTLTALFIAVAGAGVIISRTFKDVTKRQADDIEAAKKTQPKVQEDEESDD